MAVTLSSLAGAGAQFFDNNGVPLAGGLIYTYLAGTSTPEATYTSSTGVTAHANPIVLDAAGRIATGEVWLTSGVNYKFIVQTSLFVQLGSYDNIPSINDFTSIYADLANTSNPALGDALVGFRQSNSLGNLTNAVGRTVHQKLQEFVSVKDFGAVGDGVTDDTNAFLNALAVSQNVFAPAGSYRLTNTIKLSFNGQRLFGDTKINTTLFIDHILGAGVTIENSQCQLRALNITSSNTRQSVGISGSTYPLQTGLYGLKMYRAVGFLTQTLIENVAVFRQPTHGVYFGGEGGGTKFFQCESSFNRGHGYMFDDRGLEGGTSSRNGIVDIELCQGRDNGGNSINLGQLGGSSYRYNILNYESLWCAWNPSVPNYTNCQLFVGGENHVIQQSAFGDQFADTRVIMSNGDSRLAKATLGTGINLRFNTDNLVLTANRFISTNGGVDAGSNVLFIKMIGAYFGPQQLSTGNVNQPFGIKFTTTSNYGYLDVQVPSNIFVDNMVDALTPGGTLRIDDEEFYVYGEQGSALTGAKLNLTSFGASTVTSQTANVQNKFINLDATAATNLIALYFSGALNFLPPAMTFYFKNVSIYAITLKNGASAGFIRTKSGGDVIVNPGQTFVVFTDDAGNPYEV